MHEESRYMFNSNQASIPTGEKKLKSAPRAFTLGVKAEIELLFSICLKLLINAELFMVLALALRLKQGYHPIWKANL
jgi:hypothetical protein